MNPLTPEQITAMNKAQAEVNEQIFQAVKQGREFREYEKLHGITDYGRILYKEFQEVYEKLEDEDRNFVQKQLRS